MRDAHATARKLRWNFESCREALAYGLSIAWKQVNLARSIMMLNAQIAPRSAPLTTAQLRVNERMTSFPRIQANRLASFGKAPV